MRASHVVVPALASVLGACAAASGNASAPSAAAPTAALSATAGREASNGTVPPPRPGILGCVESRELKDYVLALDAQREQARRAALSALGATLDDRHGVLGSAGAATLDQSYEAGGKRFAVAAELVGETRPRRVSTDVEAPAPHFEPRVALAKQGPVLRRIDERPRAHAVDVLVCGIERCAVPGTKQRAAVRPLLVELAPGESWGGSLELAYDYWWARVRYDHHETCPAQGQQ
jgi:hypothetical protein